MFKMFLVETHVELLLEFAIGDQGVYRVLLGALHLNKATQ